MNTQTLLLTADAVATARGIIAKCQIPVILDVPAATNVVKGYVYDTVEGAHGRFEQVLAGYTSHEVYTCTLHIPAVEALDAWQVIAKREPAHNLRASQARRPAAGWRFLYRQVCSGASATGA